jgi:uncharacterized protein
VNRVILRCVVAFIVLCATSATLSPHLLAQDRTSVSRYEEKKRQSNENTITIVASGLNCTCTRFAEDIRNVLNDPSPGGLRILPILGVGGTQNLLDLLFVKNVDLIIVDQDLPEVLKKTDPVLYGRISSQVQFITKLFNSEFHMITRGNVRSYDELRGKKINFYLRDSMTAIGAENIFRMLHIDVEPTYYDEDLALQKLMSGELAGIAFFEGAPRPFVDHLKVEDGFRLLPIDEQSLPGRDLKELYDRYIPVDITHDDYPNLIPDGEVISTVSNRAVLATYNWPVNTERYNRISRFTKKFFEEINKFRDGPRHPKWKQLNAAAEVPGWTRYAPAKEWLDAYSRRAPGGEMTVKFEKFVKTQLSKSQAKPLTNQDKDVLFTQFKDFWETEHAKKEH